MLFARSHSASPERKKRKKEKKEKKKKKKKHRKKHKKEKKEEKVSKSSGGSEKKEERKQSQVLLKSGTGSATTIPSNQNVQEAKAKEGRFIMKKKTYFFK